jgi:hypothetical protein
MRITATFMSNFDRHKEPEEYEYKAYCTSPWCDGPRTTHSKHGVSKPGIRLARVYCPDCGHVLLWRKSKPEKPEVTR